MANIRVDLATTIIDGQSVTFRSPVDCSQITGLIVYYPEDGVQTSREFQFADAHGNNVGDADLFAENVLVKVILDTTLNRAYVQNADTNAYLEAQLASKAPAGLVTKTIKIADEEALNNALSEEFATMAEDSARFIVVSPTSGALFGGVGMLCELYKRSSSGYGTAKFTGYGTQSPIVFHKTRWSGVWQPMVDGSPTAFAPAGYGLGGACVPVASWDLATKNGFYVCEGWYGYVSNYYDRDTVQECFGQMSGMMYKRFRWYCDGSWKEWEWVNPPMIPGEEYRTTERWNGKPVYTKLIDCGTTVAGRKQIMNESLYGKPIRSAGKIGSSLSPFIHQKNLESTYTGYINVEVTEISVYSAVTGNHAYVTIWYVKD